MSPLDALPGAPHEVLRLTLAVAWATAAAGATAGALRRAGRRRHEPPGAAGAGTGTRLPRRPPGPRPVVALGGAVRRVARVGPPDTPTVHPVRPAGGLGAAPRFDAPSRSAGIPPIDTQTHSAEAPPIDTQTQSADALPIDTQTHSAGIARTGAPTRSAGAGDRGRAVERADRRLGWACVTAVGLLGVAPVLAAVPVAVALLAPVLAARRRRAAHEAALVDQLPDVVGLLALATAAGLPVAAAIAALRDRPGGPLGAALAGAARLLDRGATTGEALAALAAAGPAARPLVDALAHHDRYGTPLLPALERIGIESRARRRRRGEEAARTMPVTLLFPLVLTTFPAFVLLTVVPLLAGSLGSLSLTPI